MNDPVTTSIHRPPPGLGVPLQDAVILPEGAGLHNELFNSAPPDISPRTDAPGPLGDPNENNGGAEFGLTRFCEQAFVNPESTRIGSEAILKAFDDGGLWLASLVQPAQLVEEMRQQSCLLTRVVMTQWTRQGETHKLVRLADALMDAKPPVLTHEAGQIMALLASLLGILRPGPAPRWLAASRPLLRDSVDPHLLREAVRWVNAGQMLATLPQEDRHFWNRRLRDPDQDWEWGSPEALDALRRLPPLLQGDSDTLLLFQATVPRCWWELWSEHEQRQLYLPERAAGYRQASPFLLTFGCGLITGMGCMILTGWWATSWLPASFQTLAANDVPAEITETVPSDPAGFTFHAVEAAPPVNVPPPVVKPAPGQKPVIIGRRPSASPAMEARRAAAAEINAAMPELQRLHSLVRSGSEREATPHIQGRNTMASQGSKEHRALLRWLLLDPPLDPAVREQAGKAAVRMLNSQEMYDTLKLCLHPGSPNLKEARECAELLLALSGEGLDNIQRQDLMVSASIK